MINFEVPANIDNMNNTTYQDNLHRRTLMFYNVNLKYVFLGSWTLINIYYIIRLLYKKEK